MIYVDTDRCNGCGDCVEACPTGAMRIVAGKATVNAEVCRECETCMSACPVGAIMSVTEPVSESRIVATEQRVAQPGVYAGALSPVVRRPTRVLPWLGAAAGFLGRQIVPRVVDALLDAWDRRGEGGTASALDGVPLNRSSRIATGSARVGRGGRRRHQRRRRGRR